MPAASACHTSTLSAVVVGDAKAPPRLSEVLKVLDRPAESVVVNMLAVSVGDRPAVFARFLSAIVELGGRVGRPHWILVDEAHRVLPAERDPSVTALPPALPATVFVTVDPAAIARGALERVDDVFAVGTPKRSRPSATRSRPKRRRSHPRLSRAGRLSFGTRPGTSGPRSSRFISRRRSRSATGANTPRASSARTRASFSADPRTR